MEVKLELLFKTIEQENDITIIFACEVGSRNWGLDSAKSDYDVRYIYVHNSVFWYISTINKRNTIDTTIDSTSGNDGDGKIDIEISGWDLTKAIKELKVSNPSIIEWIQSVHIYINRYEFKETVMSIIDQLHNNKSLMYHYHRMLCSNLKAFFNKDCILRKKYFYVLMPTLNLIYLMEHRTCIICPNFEQLLDFCTVPQDVKTCILNLVKDKKAGKCYNIEKKILLLDTWINSAKVIIEEKLFTKIAHNETKQIKSGAPFYHALSKGHYANMSKCVTDNNGLLKKNLLLNMICDLIKTISLINNRSLTKKDVNHKLNELFKYCPSDLLPSHIQNEICDIIASKSELIVIPLNIREWYGVTIRTLKTAVHKIEDMNRNMKDIIKKTIYNDTLKDIDPNIFDGIIKTFMVNVQNEWTV